MKATMSHPRPCKSNDLEMTVQDGPTHDGVFGELTDQGPNYRNVRREQNQLPRPSTPLTTPSWAS